MMRTTSTVALALATVASLLASGCGDTPVPQRASARSTPDEATPGPRSRTAPAATPTSTAATAAPKRDPRSYGTIELEPAVLDAGSIATYGRGVATVDLVNSGDQPATVVACRSTCGCATANCPEGAVIAPGERMAVQIRVNGDSRPMRFEKDISFIFENAPPVTLLVKAKTVSAVVADPWDLIPGAPLVLRSADGVPFKVTRVAPEIVADLPTEASAEHRLTVDWGRWRRSGTARKLVLFTDHPECPQVLTMIEAPPPE